jgi:glycosyltransferase involved in cell wall biosynthesis
VITASVSLVIPRRLVAPPSYNLREALGLPSHAIVLLLPTNLRPVKDPLFLVDAMAAWHQADQRMHLALIGPTLDAPFAATVKARVRGRSKGSECEATRNLISLQIAQLPGVHYREAISAVAMQEAMLQAAAIVNCSRSEGLSTAILEALALERLVIARRNPGNESLVRKAPCGASSFSTYDRSNTIKLGCCFPRLRSLFLSHSECWLTT